MKENTKYIVLYEKIKSDIISGVYKSGDKIPGEKGLAEKYDISRQTVRQALSILEQNGLIERRQGSGTYVAEIVTKKKRTWNIGVVATHISEYIFPSILRGIESELSESGFFPVLCATHNRVDNERKILEDFLKKPIDGLIVESTKSALPSPNMNLYKEFESRGIPVVFFNNYYPEYGDCTHVIMDDKNGGRLAANHLISNGHTKIGGLFKSDDIQGLKRYEGMLQGLLENNITINDEWVFWFNSDNRNYIFEEEADAIEKCIRECSGIIAYNDEIAIKLINFLTARGYRIPKDKSIISFDNSLLSEVSTVKITSLDHPKEILGSAAARKLVAMLEGKREKSLVMDWSIVKKDSA